jgi:hypothetical protein
MNSQKGKTPRRVHKQAAFDFRLQTGKNKVNLTHLPFEQQCHDEAETN